MHQDLVELVEMALADGDLTDKKREIIFRKAENLGEDMDEFEIWLEGKISIAKRYLQQKANSTNGHQIKEGNIRKCPSCGSSISSFATTCPDCGHEFRDIDSNVSIKSFFNDYQKIEDSVQLRRKENKSLLSGFMGDDDDDLEEERRQQIFSKKKEFIMHFPIPNSREDILEFLMMAFPMARKVKKGVLGFMKNSLAAAEGDWSQKIAGVWHQKCEQIIMKARFSMKDDKETLQEIEHYAKELGLK